MERGIEQYLIVFVIMFVALADLLLGWFKRRMGKGGPAERESPPVFIEDDEEEREFLARIEREMVLKKQQDERARAEEQRAREERVLAQRSEGQVGAEDRIQAQRAEAQQKREELMQAQRAEAQQGRDDRRLQRPREAATRTTQVPDVLQRPDPLIQAPRRGAMAARDKGAARGDRSRGRSPGALGASRGGAALFGDKHDLRRAIVLREILGPPKAIADDR